MGRFRRFLALPLAEHWVLVKATSLLATIRMLLWVLPFPTARSLLSIAGRYSVRLATSPFPLDRLAWAVSVAGRLIPGGDHCLSQALTLQVLLLRRGYACRICFGVQRGPGSNFAAHAWLEHNGVVLIGGDHLNRFVKLASPADSPS